jgi:hypothetical protein
MYEFGGYRVGGRDRTLYRCGEIVPLPPGMEVPDGLDAVEILYGYRIPM